MTMNSWTFAQSVNGEKKAQSSSMEHNMALNRVNSEVNSMVNYPILSQQHG